MSLGYYALLAAFAVAAIAIGVLDRIGGALQRYEDQRGEWDS